MLHESQLAELRRDVARAKLHKPIRFVEIDARVLGAMIDEIERHRVVTLTFERKLAEPAFRD